MRAFLFLFFAFLPLFSATTFADNQALIQKIVHGAEESDSDSLVLIQNNQTLYSSYFGGKDQVRSVQSITKSMCALMVGILLEEGKISSLDLPMTTWLPEWLSDPKKSRITLRMLLNHTSGLPDVDTVPAFWWQPSTVLAAKNTPLIAEPGNAYLYSNIGTSLLQPVIEQASKQNVADYIRERIFNPLGVTDFWWNKDKVGQEVTSGGLYLSTSDLVKIGTMLLQKGSYNGQTIIRSETLQTLVTRSQPYFPYGLLFWLDQAPKPSAEPLFSAYGWGGQYITVFPAKNLIAIRTKDPYTINEAMRPKQAFRKFRELISQWE